MAGAYQTDAKTLLFSLDSTVDFYGAIASVVSGRFAITGLLNYAGAAAVFDPVTGWVPHALFGKGDLNIFRQETKCVANTTHFLISEITGTPPFTTVTITYYLLGEAGNIVYTLITEVSTIDEWAHVPQLVGLSEDNTYAYVLITGDDSVTSLYTLNLITGDQTLAILQPPGVTESIYLYLVKMITLPDGGYLLRWEYSLVSDNTPMVAIGRYNSDNTFIQSYNNLKPNPLSLDSLFFRGITSQTFWASISDGIMAEVDVNTGVILRNTNGADAWVQGGTGIILPVAIQPAGVSGFTTHPPSTYTYTPPPPIPVDPSPIVQHLAEVNAALDSTPYFDYTNNYQFFGQGLFEITLKVAQSLQSEGAGFLKWGLGRPVEDVNIPSWRANYNGTDVWSWIIAYPNGTFYYILRFGVVNITFGPYPDWTLGGITNSSWYVPL